VVLLLFHVLVHALHTHHHTLLLTVEHQRLLVQVTLDLLQTLCPDTIVSSTLRVMAPLASSSLLRLRSLAFVEYIASALCIGHHFQFSLTEFALPLINGLFELMFA
jgi:hypothetical protein